MEKNNSLKDYDYIDFKNGKKIKLILIMIKEKNYLMF